MVSTAAGEKNSEFCVTVDLVIRAVKMPINEIRSAV